MADWIALREAINALDPDTRIAALHCLSRVIDHGDSIPRKDALGIIYQLADAAAADRRRRLAGAASDRRRRILVGARVSRADAAAYRAAAEAQDQSLYAWVHAALDAAYHAQEEKGE